MFDRISPQEAAARLESGAVLIDVREADEFQNIHAVGATLIPLSEFTDRYSEMPQDKEIILICAGGVRSAQAAQYAAERGYKTTNLEGGTNAWVAAGLPTE
jgi:rhodanese-related sulfurtransferase